MTHRSFAGADQGRSGLCTGVSGFSASNLWRMRQFYQTYKDSEKLAPMVREIGWSHNVVIFEQFKVVEYVDRHESQPFFRQSLHLLQIHNMRLFRQHPRLHQLRKPSSAAKHAP